MALLCTRKQGGEAATEATLNAYLERLADCPADCALTAMERWPDKSKWFPTWHELKTEIDALSAYRRQARSIIETARNHQNREKAA
jgi:hypothetical protein